MNDNLDPAVQEAIDAVDKALTDKLGADYLIRKLDFLIREHRVLHNMPGRDDGLARRANERHRPGRHLIQEAI